VLLLLLHRQLAEAIPVAGSGLKLPLNLHTIGARCSNAYYAPRRFAAVQLAFDEPRCRVLVFHTGRLVGTGALPPPFNPRLCPCHRTQCFTGCAGPMAARLSIMRAARQLAIEADVHIHVRNFQVINQVCVCNLNTHVSASTVVALVHRSARHPSMRGLIATPLPRRTRPRATTTAPALWDSRGDLPRRASAAVRAHP
jgi:TATA-box binding protein (TBP) (component of TFIID and TFIIIB)